MHIEFINIYRDSKKKKYVLKTESDAKMTRKDKEDMMHKKKDGGKIIFKNW